VPDKSWLGTVPGFSHVACDGGTMKKLLLAITVVMMMADVVKAVEASEAVAVLSKVTTYRASDLVEHAYAGDTKIFRIRYLRHHPLEENTDIETTTASFADLDADEIDISGEDAKRRLITIQCRLMRACVEFVVDQNPRSPRDKFPYISRRPSVFISATAEAAEPVRQAFSMLIRFNQRGLPPPPASTMSVREALEVMDDIHCEPSRTQSSFSPCAQERTPLGGSRTDERQAVLISRDDYHTKDIMVQDKSGTQSAPLAELDPDRIHFSLWSLEFLSVECKDRKKCVALQDYSKTRPPSMEKEISMIRTNKVDPYKIKQALQVLIQKAK
jgi:hypothetical protein